MSESGASAYATYPAQYPYPQHTATSMSGSALYQQSPSSHPYDPRMHYYQQPGMISPTNTSAYPQPAYAYQGHPQQHAYPSPGQYQPMGAPQYAQPNGYSIPQGQAPATPVSPLYTSSFPSTTGHSQALPHRPDAAGAMPSSALPPMSPSRTPAHSPVRRPLPDPRNSAFSHAQRPSVSAAPQSPFSPAAYQPLPTPQPTPSPGPSVGPPSPSRTAIHRPTASLSSAQPVVLSAPLTHSTPIRTQPDPSRTPSSPRPLPPNPAGIPRSAGRPNLARSPSPMKLEEQAGTGTIGADSSTQQQKFVPLWKRALPAPGQYALERRNTAPSVPGGVGSAVVPSASNVAEAADLKHSTVARSHSVRPLPQSPPSSRNASAPSSHPHGPLPRPPASPVPVQPRTPVQAQPSPLSPASLPQSPRPPHSPTKSPEPLPSSQVAGPSSINSPPRSALPLRDPARSIPPPSAAPTGPLPAQPPRSRPISPVRRPQVQPPVAKDEAMHGSDDESGEGSDIASSALLARPVPHKRRVFPDPTSRDLVASSPRFGVGDLPPRAPPKHSHSQSQPQNSTVLPAPGQPQKHSLAYRLAALSLSSGSNVKTVAKPASPQPAPVQSPASTSGFPAGSGSGSGFSSNGGSRWPATLPRLPRTPGTPTQASPVQSGFTSPVKEQPQSNATSFGRPAPPRKESLSHYYARSSSPSKPPLSLDLDDAPPPRAANIGRSQSPSTQSPSAARASPSQPSPEQSVKSPQSATSTFTLSSFPAPPTSSSTWERKSPAPDTVRSRPTIPKVSFPANADEDDDDDSDGPAVPAISMSSFPSSGPSLPRFSFEISAEKGLPSISIDDGSMPTFSFGDAGSEVPAAEFVPEDQLPKILKGSILSCGGCGGQLVGRTVSAMGARWHPACFRCCVCMELLENLSGYEKDGRAYCHLDYHERFAPKCYHCQTTIVDERFITLDDDELGQRTYHEQHFFCAECGDPFLPPSAPAAPTHRSFAGDGDFLDDDVGFTVYRGHPYCEACHVRLRLPKCKRCKRPIRDGARAVEALGGKWCWECFVCASCEQPFENPAFFEREGKPFCEHCFSIMIKSEL